MTISHVIKVSSHAPLLDSENDFSYAELTGFGADALEPRRARTEGRQQYLTLLNEVSTKKGKEKPRE